MQKLLLLLFSVAIEYENKETHNVIQSTIDNKTGGESLTKSNY